MRSMAGARPWARATGAATVRRGRRGARRRAGATAAAVRPPALDATDRQARIVRTWWRFAWDSNPSTGRWSAAGKRSERRRRASAGCRAGIGKASMVAPAAGRNARHGQGDDRRPYESRHDGGRRRLASADRPCREGTGRIRRQADSRSRWFATARQAGSRIRQCRSPLGRGSRRDASDRLLDGLLQDAAEFRLGPHHRQEVHGFREADVRRQHVRIGTAVHDGRAIGGQRRVPRRAHPLRVVDHDAVEADRFGIAVIRKHRHGPPLIF